MNRDERLKNGPPTQEHYEELVDEIATTRMQKVWAYGEARYRDPDTWYAFLLLYCDIDRKLLRFRNMVMSNQYTQADGENLRESMADLANFALMGMQLCDLHFSGKGELNHDPRQMEKDVLTSIRDELDAYIKVL